MYQNMTAIGRCGQDPELRFTNSGIPVCNFSLAVNEGWTADDGQRHERTVWLRVTCWRALAETVSEYVQKGRQVMVSGKLTETRPWIDQEGNARADIEVTANIVQFLGSASEGNTGSASSTAAGMGQVDMDEAYANGYKAALQELAAKAAQNAKQEAANAMAEVADAADKASSDVAEEKTPVEEAVTKEPAKDGVYRPSAISTNEAPAVSEPEVTDKPDDDAETDDEDLSMVIDASNMLDQIQNTISTEAKEVKIEEKAEAEVATVDEDLPF